MCTGRARLCRVVRAGVMKSILGCIVSCYVRHREKQLISFFGERLFKSTISDGGLFPTLFENYFGAIY